MFKNTQTQPEQYQQNSLVFVSYYLSLPSTKPNPQTRPKPKQQAAVIAHAQAAAANHQKQIDELNRAAMIQRIQAANQAAAVSAAAAARPGVPIGMVSFLVSPLSLPPWGGVSLSMFV